MATFMLHNQHSGLLLERQKGKGGRVEWLLSYAQPWVDMWLLKPGGEQPGWLSTLSSGGERQLLSVAGLPVIKSSPMFKNCCRQLVVLGAEEIPWQGFFRFY